MVDGYDKGVPSRELTYPPDKAYLKMIFLQVGYVNFLEGIYIYIYSIYQNGFSLQQTMAAESPWLTYEAWWRWIRWVGVVCEQYLWQKRFVGGLSGRARAGCLNDLNETLVVATWWQLNSYFLICSPPKIRGRWTQFDYCNIFQMHWNHQVDETFGENNKQPYSYSANN